MLYAKQMAAVSAVMSGLGMTAAPGRGTAMKPVKYAMLPTSMNVSRASQGLPLLMDTVSHVPSVAKTANQPMGQGQISALSATLDLVRTKWEAVQYVIHLVQRARWPGNLISVPPATPIQP